MDSSETGKPEIESAGRPNLKEFSTWLDQFPIAVRSKQLYVWAVEKFLKENRELSEQGLNLFLKDHRRLYFKAALRYYFKFRGVTLDFSFIKMKEPERVIRYVPTREEIGGILEKIRLEDPDLYQPLRISFMTGARIAEVLSLKLMQLEGGKINFMTKGEIPREAFADPAKIQEIREYVTREKGTLEGERCFYPNIKKIENAYRVLRRHIANLKTLTPDEKTMLMRTHNFRRANINKILDLSDDNILVAWAYIGHGSAFTTQKYVDERKREKLKARAVNLLEGKDIYDDGAGAAR